jgi:hypothetical protein
MMVKKLSKSHFSRERERERKGGGRRKKSPLHKRKKSCLEQKEFWRGARGEELGGKVRTGCDPKRMLLAESEGIKGAKARRQTRQKPAEDMGVSPRGTILPLKRLSPPAGGS